MKIKNKNLVFVVFLFAAVVVYSSTGSTSNFLKIAVGARASGMAEAFAALSDDVSSIYYNPAGLAQVGENEFSFGYNRYIESINYFFGAYTMPIIRGSRRKRVNYGNVAVAIYHLGMPDIDGYNYSGEKGLPVSVYDLAVSLGYSKRLLRYYDVIDMPDYKPGLYTGINLKMINKKLAEISRSGFTFDTGILFIPKIKVLNGNLRLGCNVQNIIGGLTFENEMSKFPFNTKIALALRNEFYGNSLTTGIDYNLEPNFVGLGAEYSIMDSFCIRAGYKYANNAYVDNGLRVGLGVGVNDIKFDYSFSPMVTFGETHKVDITFKFGKQKTSLDLANFLIDKHYKRAMVLLNSYKYIPAYKELQYVIKLDPTHPQASKEIEKIESLFRQVSQAREKERLQKEVADNFKKAKALFDKGELIQSKEIFQIILKLDPEHQESKNYIGRIENIQKENLKQRIGVYFAEGMSLFEKKEFEKAIRRWQDVLEIDPNHKNAKEYIKIAQDKIKEKEKLQTELDKKRVLSEIYKRSINYFNEKQYKNAVDGFEKVLSIDPNYLDAKKYLEQSRELYKVKLEEDRKKSAQLYTEGLKAYTSGNTKKAYEIWKEAVELDPENEKAKKGLERLEKEISK